MKPFYVAESETYCPNSGTSVNWRALQISQAQQESDTISGACTGSIWVYISRCAPAPQPPIHPTIRRDYYSSGKLPNAERWTRAADLAPHRKIPPKSPLIKIWRKLAGVTTARPDPVPIKPPHPQDGFVQPAPQPTPPSHTTTQTHFRPLCPNDHHPRTLGSSLSRHWQRDDRQPPTHCTTANRAVRPTLELESRKVHQPPTELYRSVQGGRVLSVCPTRRSCSGTC